MASLREKVEAELEQMDQALRELPGARRVSRLSVLELGGTASLVSSLYHGVENILKQGLLASGVALPSGAAWHRDLLQSACEQGMISTELPGPASALYGVSALLHARLRVRSRSTTAGAAGSGCSCGLCLLQEGGETFCEIAGEKWPRVKTPERAVTGKS